MRLFVAIDVPKNIAEELHKRLVPIYEEYRKEVLFVDRKKFHLTLMFFKRNGRESIESSLLADIKTILAELEPLATPWQCEAGNVKIFSSTHNAKVLVLDVTSDMLSTFAHELEKRCSAGGFETGEKFHLHLTVGRLKTKIDAEALKEKISKTLAGGLYRWEAHEYVLYESLLNERGSIYKKIETYPRNYKGEKQ